MIISHRHKFLYFVVPKTGSATIRKSLAPFVDIGWPVANYTQHVPISAFMRSEHAALFGEYFKFTFVRNPYDRLYSGYLQDRFAGENYARWIRVKKPIFDAIGDDFPRYLHEYAMKGDIESDWQWICFCPMSEFALDEQGNLAVDFVGRAETLETDMARLGACLSLPVRKAPDENVRNGLCEAKPKYLRHFDRQSVSTINQRYRRDFELFGYEMLDPLQFPVSLPAP